MPRQYVAWVFVVLCGCNAPARPPTPVFEDSRVIEAISDAASVEAYRLPSRSHHRDSLSDFKMIDGPITVPDSLSEELREIFFDAASFDVDSLKSCIPDYGVRIRFQYATGDVDVLLCFDCDILAVYYKGEDIGGESFDVARPQLLTIAKQLFPENDDIQALE